ncbi:hypothetical protein [Fusobacterium gastrosuis]|uniref:hypothetical protein n=1 Tax=Fusobacterium gastrosuis TaxID=1755100 RepID=UPI00297A9471|nr:hypothetical protein [Fusobacteriaceae bacterium]MDY2573810.1 hypothetical protein [Fusobacterium necrophorum]MDY5713599.1 hypothetical protein [Fusobacterium gastrosuis]
MRCNIIQEFQGEIDEIEFHDRRVFSAVEYLLDKVEAKFGEVYNKDFVSDLKGTIERMEEKYYDDFSFAVLENDFSECIEEAKAFNEIEFLYYGNDWKIEYLNKNIKNNKYELSNEKVNSWDKRSQGIGIAD